MLLGRDRNGIAVVGHLDNYVIILAHPGSNVDVLRAGLQGILDKIEEDLRDLSLIGLNHQVVLLRPILAGGTTAGSELAVQAYDIVHQLP